MHLGNGIFTEDLTEFIDSLNSGVLSSTMATKILNVLQDNPEISKERSRIHTLVVSSLEFEGFSERDMARISDWLYGYFLIDHQH